MNSDERRKVENQLLMLGLRQLTDPQLIEQLGQLVTGHEFLLGLINECDQDQRSAMFEAIRPHLRFEPWPLDRYIAKLKQHASNIDSAVNPIEVGDRTFQPVPAAEATGCVLTLKCHKCTGAEDFYGETPVTAMLLARESGWVFDIAIQKHICPRCPAVRERKPKANLPN